MKKIRILHISDMQNGFTREDGNLYIQGARNIIAPIHAFLRRVRYGDFDVAFIVQDTHFAEEYCRSEESRTFPIHCEYGTRDWELSVDVSGLPNTWYLMKNRYDMWSAKGPDIPFTDPKRRTAYDTLFHVVDDPHDPAEISTRDEFMKAVRCDRTSAALDVTLIGVASDYCNRYAMEGWLARGAHVTILRDLTKGIEKETPQVLAEDAYRHYTNGRLRAVDSAEYTWE